MIPALLQSVFPRYCAVCERIGDYLCENCRLSLQTVSSPCCPKKNFHYDSHHAIFVFNESIKKLIHDFKYNHEFWIKDFFLQYMAPLKKYFSDVDVILPVPLHLRQLKHRGYNQSLHLAILWARVLEKPVQRFFLLRVKDTLSQTGLDRKARKKNLADAFAVGDESLVRHKNILLVDDVHTTGTTLSEAARVLKKSGAVSVLATSIAVVR